MKRAAILLLAAFVGCKTAAAPLPPGPVEKRPLVAKDIYRMLEVTSVELSPDGQTILYTLRRFNEEDDRYDTSVWSVPTAGGEPSRLLDKGGSLTFSPDGSRVAYTTGSQIWTMRPDGGGTRQVTDIKAGASGPVWSPDGTRIAFTTKLQNGQGFDEEPEAENTPKGDPKIVQHATYRRRGSYYDNRYSQICVVEVESGQVTKLTDGDWDCSRPTWSPDGTRIAFGSTRGEPRNFNRNSDLWIVPAAGGGMKRFTTNKGPDGSPAWSPDGRHIAYTGTVERKWGVWQSDIWIKPVDGGRAINLTTKFDRRIRGRLRWSKDSKRIHFSASDQGAVRVFELEIEKLAVTPLTPERAQVRSFSGDAMSVTTIHQPAEVWFRGKRLTQHNDAWLATVWLAPQKEVWFDSGDGFRIHGWYQPPYNGGDKVPMILEIHGGPSGMYGWRWFFEMQLLSSAGYAVFYANPRGSSGYGEKFMKANEKDWGGGDYRDLMAGVDTILKTHPEIDAENLGVTGGSYGGYMTNWVVGHTDRFKAAVTQRCVSNLISFMNSDIHVWLCERYFNTNPWKDHELLWKHSPIAYVDKVRTPLLILHSEGDFRCPINQAEELFVSLKRLNQAPVEFVRYPEETHELSRSGTPSRRLDRLERIVGWFRRYLEGQTVN